MTNNTPKVSIVIPVYNGSNFLREAINSALDQTYPNTEIIVINDGSRDGGETERIARSFGNKIRYYLKKNGGVASALNYGIQKMTGDYFSWLSHDDLYKKTKIKEEIEYLFTQANPTNTIVGCNSFAFFQNGIKKKEKINQIIFDNYFDIFLGASAKVGLNGCSLLIPRQILKESTQFREDLPVTQDYDLWYRLKNNARFVLLDRSLVVYRHHDMQDSIQKRDTILFAGDQLRSNILKSVANTSFTYFMLFTKNNEKWIWENYTIYKRRGYIKAPLAILKLLAVYYKSGSKQTSRVELEVFEFEQKYLAHQSHDLKRFEATDETLVERAETLINVITKDDYESSGFVSTSKLLSYIQSIKSDGLLFFIEKILRKLTRPLRRKKG